MKNLFCILSLAFALTFSANTADAQVARGITKAAKKLITKPKPTPKPRTYTPKVRPRTTTSYVTCGACNGNGRVSVWNPYYQCYQTSTCNRCSGTGRVRSSY